MGLFLTEADVRRVLPLDDLIAVMENALGDFAAGRVIQPLRTVLEVGPERAYFGVMPAYLAPRRPEGCEATAGAAATSPTPNPLETRHSKPETPTEAPAGALGTKLVTVFAGNPSRGLPTHLATILLFDPDTGALLAVMDGRYITEARTAAVSAVSVRCLAAPAAGTLAVLGSGVQARSHLEAIARVRRLRAVRVWSPTEAHRRAFAREMAERVAAPVEAADNPEAALRNADLIVLATSAERPVLLDEWVAPGAHVVGVGACRPDQREMDPSLVARGRLFVDSRAAALAEAGDIVLSIAEGRFGPDHLAGEIGQVVNGEVAGRMSAGEITIFKSLGMAVEDVAAAHLAYRRAREQGIGTDLPVD